MSHAKQVLLSLKELLKNKIEGIAIDLPGHLDNLCEITAVIDGPVSTPFEHGAFKVRLKMTDEFPKAPPKAYFLTKVFHPNVDPKSGEVCVRKPSFNFWVAEGATWWPKNIKTFIPI